MWFSTLSALTRYDGYSFTQYKPKPFDSTSIAANIFWSLHEDRSGMPWVGSGLGVLSRSRSGDGAGTVLGVKVVKADRGARKAGYAHYIHL